MSGATLISKASVATTLSDVIATKASTGTSLPSTAPSQRQLEQSQSPERSVGADDFGEAVSAASVRWRQQLHFRGADFSVAVETDGSTPARQCTGHHTSEATTVSMRRLRSINACYFPQTAGTRLNPDSKVTAKRKHGDFG